MFSTAFALSVLTCARLTLAFALSFLRLLALLLLLFYVICKLLLFGKLLLPSFCTPLPLVLEAFLTDGHKQWQVPVAVFASQEVVGTVKMKDSL